MIRIGSVVTIDRSKLTDPDDCLLEHAGTEGRGTPFKIINRYHDDDPIQGLRLLCTLRSLSGNQVQECEVHVYEIESSLLLLKAAN